MRYILFSIALVALSSCSNYHSSLRFSRKSSLKTKEVAEDRKEPTGKIISTIDDEKSNKTNNSILTKNETHEVHSVTSPYSNSDAHIMIQKHTYNSNADTLPMYITAQTPITNSKIYPGPKNKRKSKNGYEWLAITGFIMVLLCLIPFAPFLGLIACITAVILITHSNSTRGRGLAFLGIVLGVFSCMINYLLLNFMFS